MMHDGFNSIARSFNVIYLPPEPSTCDLTLCEALVFKSKGQCSEHKQSQNHNPFSVSEMELLATPTATSSLQCAFLPRKGLFGTPGSAGREGRCVRKVGPVKITAKFELKPPPYPLNALEPVMSERTFEFHWGKHHRAYVDNLNKQIAGTDLEGKSLEDVVVITYNKGDPLPPFNNAGQVWNHDFFWVSMKPGGGGAPSGELLQLIERDFGSLQKFSDEFKAAAATQFGSGWAWLVFKDNKLAVVKTPNAVNPLVMEGYPLLTIDVWEHAYYLDYQNRRPDYISLFMEKLVSWDAVSKRLEQAKALV